MSINNNNNNCYYPPSNSDSLDDKHSRGNLIKRVSGLNTDYVNQSRPAAIVRECNGFCVHHFTNRKKKNNVLN